MCLLCFSANISLPCSLSLTLSLAFYLPIETFIFCRKTQFCPRFPQNIWGKRCFLHSRDKHRPRLNGRAQSPKSLRPAALVFICSCHTHTHTHIFVVGIYKRLGQESRAVCFPPFYITHLCLEILTVSISVTKYVLKIGQCVRKAVSYLNDVPFFENVRMYVEHFEW